MTEPLFTLEELEALRREFPIKNHDVRYGFKSGSATRYFVWVKSQYIIDRLDELFLGEWGQTPGQQIIAPDSSGILATVNINIRGITRSATAWQKGLDDKSVKGAYTLAFRKAAEYWGIALYIKNSPDLNCSSEAQAKNIFYDWYMKTYRPDEIEDNIENPEPKNITSIKKHLPPANGKTQTFAEWVSEILRVDTDFLMIWKAAKHRNNAVAKMIEHDIIDASMEKQDVRDVVKMRYFMRIPEGLAYWNKIIINAFSTLSEDEILEALRDVNEQNKGIKKVIDYRGSIWDALGAVVAHYIGFDEDAVSELIPEINWPEPTSDDPYNIGVHMDAIAEKSIEVCNTFAAELEGKEQPE